MPKEKPKLICIVGPTASGKTEWGIKLAKKIDGEIISADSRQVYKKMDIGTGKPCTTWGAGQALNQKENKVEIEGVPHYLINILEPDEKITAALFKDKALQIIKKIKQKQKNPIMVGGTGLYIKAVTENYQFPPKTNEHTRKRLRQKPLKKLANKLKGVAAKTAAEINLKNKRRVVRALELELSDNTNSAPNKKIKFNTLQVGKKLSRDELHQKIDNRVDEMIRRGLETEVRKLVKEYGWNSIIKKTIGYQEWRAYFKKNSNKDKEEIIQRIKAHTRQYAKRQLTWFNNKTETTWVKNFKQAFKLVKNFLGR